MSRKIPTQAEVATSWLPPLPKNWIKAPLYTVTRRRKSSNRGMRETNLLSLSYGNVVRRDINGSEGLLPESFETYQVIEPNDIVLRLTDLQNDQRSLRSALAAERGIITSAYVTLIPEGINPRFLAYVLRAYDHQKVFYGMGAGVRQTLAYEDLRLLPVLIPPRTEQQAIADFLDRETAKIDALIDKCQRLCDQLEVRRRQSLDAAIQQLNGPQARLGQVTQKIKDGTHGSYQRVDADGHFPLLSAKNVSTRGLLIGEDESYIALPDYREITKAGFPRRGDVLLVIIGATIGKSMVYEMDQTHAFQRSVAFLRPTQRVNSEFLNFQIQSSAFQEQLRLRTKTSAQPGIYLQDLAQIPIVVPPLEDQQRTVRAMHKESLAISGLVRRAQELAQISEERRSALITAAVTGKIDVTTGKAYDQQIGEG